MFSEILREFCVIVIVVSGLPLLAATLTGLVVSSLQAATQIQEQTTVFLVKVVTIGVSLFFCLDWFSGLLLRFFEEALRAIAVMGG